MELKLPNNKKFIFTIIDDTDDAFCEQIKPVYDIIYENGLKTTKTVWVYPVRDHNLSKGHCLQDINYRDFIIDIKNKGFEIALHNVGSGIYFRNEILEGLDYFKEIIGHYPKIHVNRSYNPDNIYCGEKRFSFPFNYLLRIIYSSYSDFSGEIPESKHFWGDVHKRIIKYSRNYEIDSINTLKYNPYMPYKDDKYEKFSNEWFSSSFAPNQWIFNKMVTKESVDKLEEEGGVCILYTHLGYYNKHGKVDQGFKEMVSYIGKKNNGLFIPVSEVLEILNKNKIHNGVPAYIPKLKKFKIEFLSLFTRMKYRYINKIDDYHFKKSGTYNDIL